MRRLKRSENVGVGHFVGRAGVMTTVWRPHVRREIPNSDDAKVEVEVPEEVNKGVKRKRAPPTKGPCEHGVKHRSNCKVCSACPHGRQRLTARSAVGHEYASTVVSAVGARSAVGHAICEHGRQRSHARSAVVHQYASTVVSALRCKECGGASICEHGRERSQCKECGGGAICEHGRRRSTCKECGGCIKSASTVVGAIDARSVGGA